MTRYLIVPQWQGSPSSRAMALADGAQAISGDLPRSASEEVAVPLEAGESLETGILRASALQRVRESLETALRHHKEHRPDEHVVLIGGDCSITVAAVSSLAHPDVALVWFDAHPDLHTPESSISGAYGGMALRAAIGDTTEPSLSASVSPDRVVLVGARSRDDAEQEYIEASAITDIAADALHDAEVIANAVAATGATSVYVHIDLDVLDPAEIAGVGDAVPFGVTRVQVVDSIKALRARFPLAGATIAGFSPAHPTAALDDLGTILRIVGSVA